MITLIRVLIIIIRFNHCQSTFYFHLFRIIFFQYIYNSPVFTCNINIHVKTGEFKIY